MILNKNLHKILLVILTLVLSACSTAKKSGNIEGDVYTGSETVEYLQLEFQIEYFCNKQISLTTASRAT